MKAEGKCARRDDGRRNSVPVPAPRRAVVASKISCAEPPRGDMRIVPEGFNMAKIHISNKDNIVAFSRRRLKEMLLEANSLLITHNASREIFCGIERKNIEIANFIRRPKARRAK